jgi:hypothetical protein
LHDDRLWALVHEIDPPRDDARWNHRAQEEQHANEATSEAAAWSLSLVRRGRGDDFDFVHRPSLSFDVELNIIVCRSAGSNVRRMRPKITAMRQGMIAAAPQRLGDRSSG